MLILNKFDYIFEVILWINIFLIVGTQLKESFGVRHLSSLIRGISFKQNQTSRLFPTIILNNVYKVYGLFHLKLYKIHDFL